MGKPTKTYDVKLSDLRPDDHNANRGSERGRGMLSESLSRYGAGRSIVVDANGKTVAGNKTLESMVAAGMTDAIVVESDGTRAVVIKRTDWNLDDRRGAARAYAYADNRVAQIDLSWDAEVLGDDLANGVDLGSMWSNAELEQLMGIANSDPGGDSGDGGSAINETCDKCGAIIKADK